MASTTLRRLGALALFAAPLPLAAQSATFTDAPAPVAVSLVAPAPAPAPAFAPTLGAARLGAARAESVVRADAAAEAERLRRRLTKRESQAWMIVGGAAFVAGLLIGDDVGTVLAVGGAAGGLYGLWNYLQ